jgi:hypothetical protein
MAGATRSNCGFSRWGGGLSRRWLLPSSPIQFPAKKTRGVPQKTLRKFRARVWFALRVCFAKRWLGLPTVHVSWVRQETRAGRMPHLELGRYRRYSEQAVLDWLETQRSGTWRKHEPKVRTS